MADGNASKTESGIVEYHQFLSGKTRHAKTRQSLIVGACLAVPWAIAAKAWPVGPQHVTLVVGTAVASTVVLVVVLMLGGRFERAHEDKVLDEYRSYLMSFPVEVLRAASTSRELDLTTRVCAQEALDALQRVVAIR